MITWKLLWQGLFIFGFLFFIVMFFIFSVSGFHELKKLLSNRDE
jgi:hypothetical protein